MRNISVKLFHIWTSGSVGDFVSFLFYSSGYHCVWQAKLIWAILVDDILSKK